MTDAVYSALRGLDHTEAVTLAGDLDASLEANGLPYRGGPRLLLEPAVFHIAAFMLPPHHKAA